MIKTIVAFVVVAFDSIAINPLPALSKPCASSVLSSRSFSLTVEERYIITADSVFHFLCPSS